MYSLRCQPPMDGPSGICEGKDAIISPVLFVALVSFPMARRVPMRPVVIFLFFGWEMPP